MTTSIADAVVDILHPGHTAADLPPKVTSVPLVSEGTLRLARETAHALEMISGGWPELTSRGFHDYLNDGAAAIYDLADAVEQMQRALQ